MKSISAKANYNPEVLERLFSTADRARVTTSKILAARSSSCGKFESHGLTLTTDKKKSRAALKNAALLEAKHRLRIR